MSRKFLTGIDVNNQPITSLADGSAPTDAVTLQQLQAFVRGLNWKASARVKTTSNLNLASPGVTINGVTMATGDRILVASQTTGSDNGLYIWNGAATAATRSPDADTAAELTGAAVYVTEGTVNPDTAWTVTTDAITLGTTSIAFAQFGGGTAVTAGNGLTGTSVLAILLDSNSGLLVSGSGLKVDTSVLARKASFDCAATTNPQTFTHNLGTKDVVVEVRRLADDVIVIADVTASSTSVVSVNFGGAPTAAQYRVTVIG